MSIFFRCGVPTVRHNRYLQCHNRRQRPRPPSTHLVRMFRRSQSNSLGLCVLPRHAYASKYLHSPCTSSTISHQPESASAAFFMVSPTAVRKPVDFPAISFPPEYFPSPAPRPLRVSSSGSAWFNGAGSNSCDR